MRGAPARYRRLRRRDDLARHQPRQLLDARGALDDTAVVELGNVQRIPRVPTWEVDGPDREAGDLQVGHEFVPPPYDRVDHFFECVRDAVPHTRGGRCDLVGQTGEQAEDRLENVVVEPQAAENEYRPDLRGEVPDGPDDTAWKSREESEDRRDHVVIDPFSAVQETTEDRPYDVAQCGDDPHGKLHVEIDNS